LAVTENNSWHRSPTAPQPEALSIIKSEPAEALPTLNSPIVEPFSEKLTKEKDCIINKQND